MRKRVEGEAETEKKRKFGPKHKRKPREGKRRTLTDIAVSIVTEYDYFIILLVTILVVFGIVMVFSAGYYSTVNLSKPDPYYYLKKQSFFAVTGFAIMLVMARFDYHRFIKAAPYFVVISLVLLAALFTPLGVTVNYATRWIVVLGVRITPSEISKLAVIIFTAVFLSQDPDRIKSFSKGILPLLAIMGVHAAMIIKQPNLSTAIVICAIMLSVMFVAGLDIKIIGGMIGVLAAGLTYILLFLHNTHWYARLTSWTNPFADSQGSGYQVSQSIIALGNGGIKGLGLGNSIAKNLYLPEPQNDFILAIIGEELGFVRVAILMAVYLILIWRCFNVAAKAKDKLGLYLATGISVMLGLQVIINVAVVTASMPATGITLPFVSYGGTSLWVFMASMGILLNISKKKGKEKGTVE